MWNCFYFITCPETHLTKGKKSLVIIWKSKFEISIYHHLSRSSIYWMLLFIRKSSPLDFMEDLLWCALQIPNTSRTYSGVGKAMWKRFYFITCPNTYLTNDKISLVITGKSKIWKYYLSSSQYNFYIYLREMASPVRILGPYWRSI